MHLPSRSIRRVLVLVLLLAVAALVGRKLAGPGTATGSFVPAIGGDTWPPVPVKDVRPA